MNMTPERAREYGYIVISSLDGGAREMAIDLLTAYLAATDEIERLRRAGIAALRFIENTESEMGIILGCGDSLRQALKQKEPKP